MKFGCGSPSHPNGHPHSVDATQHSLLVPSMAPIAELHGNAIIMPWFLLPAFKHEQIKLCKVCLTLVSTKIWRMRCCITFYSQ